MKERRRLLVQRAVTNRQPDLCVLLDNIVDSHNVGAVVRTSDSVGIQRVCVVNYENPRGKKTFTVGKRTSSGARKWVDVEVYRETDKCLRELKSTYGRIIATSVDPGARSLYDLDLTGPCVIAFGNEENGISEEVKNAADELIYIPQMGLTKSLNISVACAVVLYETCRQRLIAGSYGADLDQSRWHKELMANFMERQEGTFKGEQPHYKD